MKVIFDGQHLIQGCEIINYLLEKSRVVSQSSMERNYHIFYQLISGSTNDQRTRYHLKPADQFRYLNTSGCTQIDGVDDAKELVDVQQAMTTLQFSPTTVDQIFQILAGILHLGRLVT